MFQVRLNMRYIIMRNQIYEKYGCCPFFVHFMYCGAQPIKKSIPHVNFGKRDYTLDLQIDTPGAVNVIILTRGKLKVITTTAIKGVSDGGSVDPYTAVNHALPSLIQEHNVPFVDDNTTTTEDSVSLSNTEPDSSTPSIQDVDVLSNNAPTASILPVQIDVGRPTTSILKHSLVPPSVDASNINAVRTSRQHNKKTRFAPDLPSSVPAEATMLSSRVESNKVRGNIAERDANKYHQMVSNWKTRSQRMMSRQHEVANRVCAEDDTSKTQTHQVQSTEKLFIKKSKHTISNDELVEQCCFVDWSMHTEESYYLSLASNSYIIITNNNTAQNEATEDSYRAVTENIPKNFTAALQDPVWGAPARIEFDTIIVDTKAVVEINRDIAKSHIENGAEVLRMMPVYEEKIKNGQLVRKVRLVADGRFHLKHGNTYSPTPSREELYIILHIFAANDMEYYFIDEVRAFLNAKKRDKNITLARFSGDPKYYQIVNALYGMKTASADYQHVVADRLKSIGFTRLSMCNCIYIWHNDGNTVLVYDYVDDFIFGGNSNEITFSKLSEFRTIVRTTEPELNGPRILGMEIKRDRERRTIMLTMIERILDLSKQYPEAILKKRSVPMPKSGYLVKEYEIESLPANKKAVLDKHGIEKYMSIVGCLIWIQGVRMDIIFTVLYLSWNTKCPKQHHLSMAEYCIGYLYHTKEYPLVLGGPEEIRITGYTDASLATGPKSRSITGQIIKLNEQSGAIYAKARAGHQVLLSSFEGELDGTTNMMKSIARVSNTTDEMDIKAIKPNLAYTDNEAMMKFVKGEGVAKGVRHMEMRMWYIRDEYAKGDTDIHFMNGVKIPTDKLTKLGTADEHRVFCSSILGHSLLDIKYLEQLYK